MRGALLLSAAVCALAPTMDAFAQDDPQTFYLKPDQMIVVTASPFALDADETPAIVEQVGRDRILDAGGASIADSLRQIPGIAASNFAAGSSRPIIRGMDATRVKVLEDGLSSSDVSDVAPDHGIPIDPLTVDRIEVIRGAGTLRYGSQAIGGVVNAINNRIPKKLPDEPASGEIIGAYDSVSEGGSVSASAEARAGQFAVHGDGFYRHANDYDTPLGTQANSFVHSSGGSLGGSYFFDDQDSYAGLAIQQYDSRYGLPSDDTFVDMRQTKFVGDASIDLGIGVLDTLNVDGSYADYKHDENEPDGTTLATFKNKEFDSHAELLFAPMGAFENTAVGLQVQRRRFEALGHGSEYLLPTLTQSEAGYVFSEMPLQEDLRLQASGRVEHVHVHGTPASGDFTERNFVPVSGALGALYDVNEAVKLGLTFSSTARAPAITELFARGAHEGTETYETGDPNLKIERSNSLEATLRADSGPFGFEGSVYGSWFSNYIYGAFTGRTCSEEGDCINGPGEELNELFYEQQGAFFRGVEALATYRVWENENGWLETRLQGDYVRATFDGGDNVPRIPPYRVGGGIGWTSALFDVDVDYLYNGPQKKVGDYETDTDSYNDLRAKISLRPFTEYPGVQLDLIGQNLTNDVQRDAASFTKEDVVLPGRNVRLVLTLATN